MVSDERVVKAIKALKAEVNQETVAEILLVGGKAFAQGIGLPWSHVEQLIERGLKESKANSKIRVRFFANSEDYRPIKFPPPYPYWCSGETGNSWVLIGYFDNEDQIYQFWPEAKIDFKQEVTEIKFSDRFPKPDWWNGEGEYLKENQQ